jgi:hypothetical protein
MMTHVLWKIWVYHWLCWIRETHSFQQTRYYFTNNANLASPNFHRNAIFSSNKMILKGSKNKEIMVEEKEDLSMFQSCLDGMLLPKSKQEEILLDLQNKGFTSSSELYAIAIDFQDKPRILSEVLMEDFGFSAAKSHVVRGALLRLVQAIHKEKSIHVPEDNLDSIHNDLDSIHNNTNIKVVTDATTEVAATTTSVLSKEIQMKNSGKEKTQPLFKSVIVNPKAKKRHTDTHQEHTYGLPNNYRDKFPTLAHELDQFESFMIMPSAASAQESPIRNATASVYMRHAKLFLGWYHNVYTTQNRNETNDSTCNNVVSINDIFPNKDATSAQSIIDFILWLRKTREISHSYEANMLRGLTKLLKFRFHKESQSDPSYGEKSFNDIPVVRELRKLHRDANRRQNISPRSSEEDRKWLDWNEYLTVVQKLKEDVQDEIKSFVEKKRISKSNVTARRRIATKFQAYLILAFFSCVPDRQRTFRELEIGRSFLRDDKINCWVIKHGPDDYKTGKTYGDRPPLVITPELSPAIDDFLERWRPSLEPTGDHFFVQPRTGKCLTQDSVYSIVARSCFKHTGKKTNPHLLRDMIVTHVRNTNASEKELEALALYMGHSISMQRNSYDRRTMEQKVAPAVELLRNVNST